MSCTAKITTNKKRLVFHIV